MLPLSCLGVGRSSLFVAQMSGEAESAILCITRDGVEADVDESSFWANPLALMKESQGLNP